ncbi:MAG TPA: tripartite tricarboxylate transporter substrate binding protein [Burkholderiaceae bacterium]|nr:tripartite tricarboxylate transporter substrate binding protein [Burkholderiaceae bacterium]
MLRRANVSLRLRRGLLALAAAALLPGAAVAQAQEFPGNRPITIVMTFPAGSGVDVVGRIIQEPLAKVLGTQILIDYRPGAAGNIALEYVSRAKPDGHTLLFGTSATHGVNPALYRKLPFDVEADFTPIAPINDVSNVLTINPAVINVNTVEEFIKEVRANPGKYNFASTGNGTGTHLAFAEFNKRAGLDMVHVPYKGGPDAMQGVLQGQVCCIMNQVQTVIGQWRAGKVRLLGVTTPTRVSTVPDVPTIAESGLPGFESYIWFGLWGPRGMDPKIVDTINSAVRQVLQMPEVANKITGMGNALRIETPEQFRKTVRENRERWARVVKDVGVTID